MTIRRFEMPLLAAHRKSILVWQFCGVLGNTQAKAARNLGVSRLNQAIGTLSKPVNQAGQTLDWSWRDAQNEPRLLETETRLRKRRLDGRGARL